MAVLLQLQLQPMAVLLQLQLQPMAVLLQTIHHLH